MLEAVPVETPNFQSKYSKRMVFDEQKIRDIKDSAEKGREIHNKDIKTVIGAHHKQITGSTALGLTNNTTTTLRDGEEPQI